MLKSISMLCAAAILAASGAALAQEELEEPNATAPMSQAELEAAVRNMGPVPQGLDGDFLAAPTEAFGTSVGYSWVDARDFVQYGTDKRLRYALYEYFVPPTNPTGPAAYRAPVVAPVGSKINRAICNYMLQDGDADEITFRWKRFDGGVGTSAPTSETLATATVAGGNGSPWYFATAIVPNQDVTMTYGGVFFIVPVVEKHVIEAILTSRTQINGCWVLWQRQISPAPSTATFSDVPVGNAYHPAVEAVVAAGITAGCGGGKFCPESVVTRKQMAVFLAKALGLNYTK